MGDITVPDVCSTSCICGGQAWGISWSLMSVLRLVSVVARLGGHRGYRCLLYVLYMWWPGLGDIMVLDVCSTSCVCGGQAWGTSRFLMSALRVVSAVARLGGHRGY